VGGGSNFGLGGAKWPKTAMVVAGRSVWTTPSDFGQEQFSIFNGER